MFAKGDTVTVLTKEGLFSCRTISEVLANGSLRMAPVMFLAHVLQPAETFPLSAIWKCKEGCGCGTCVAKRKFTLVMPDAAAVPPNKAPRAKRERPEASKGPTTVSSVEVPPVVAPEPVPEPPVAETEVVEEEVVAVPATQKRRGRPPGSKNKPKGVVEERPVEDVAPVIEF